MCVCALQVSKQPNAFLGQLLCWSSVRGFDLHMYLSYFFEFKFKSRHPSPYQFQGLEKCSDPLCGGIIGIEREANIVAWTAYETAQYSPSIAWDLLHGTTRLSDGPKFSKAAPKPKGH